MIESIIVGTGLLVAWAIGFAAGRMSKRPAPAKLGPICPCEHSIGHHKDQKGACSAQMKRKTFNSSSGVYEEWVPCGCMHYSGPELLSTFMARELEP